MMISERYRNKALACEKLALELPNHDFKCAWSEIAIEWHALANRIAKEGLDRAVTSDKSGPVRSRYALV